MPRFRVLAGIHSEKDSKGVPQKYRKGDVVVTETDLLKLNSTGAMKFEKLEDETPREREARESKESKEGKEGKESVESQRTLVAESRTEEKQQHAQPPRLTHPALARLDQMTANDLKKLAEDEEIDLKGAKQKEEMVKILRVALSE